MHRKVSADVNSLIKLRLDFRPSRIKIFVVFRADCELSSHCVYSNPYLHQIYVRLLLSSDATQPLTGGQSVEIKTIRGDVSDIVHRTDNPGVNVRPLCDASVLTAFQVQPTKIHTHDDSRQLASKFPVFQGPRQNVAVCTTPH